MTGRLALLGRSARWLVPLAFLGPGSKRTTGDLIERRAAAQPDDVFVRFEGRVLRYGAYNAAANRVADWARAEGLAKGDVVALLMQNRPEYLEVWAGLAKLGITTALVNTQLVGDALTHALRVSGARHAILGTECVSAWCELPADVTGSLVAHVLSDPGSSPPAGLAGFLLFDDELAGRSESNPPRELRAELRGSDPLFYIYTSGTTGLPKAARFSHARFAGGGTYALLGGFGRGDTLYCPLPLYHTVGGVMCVNAVLRAGGTLALARRFSASRFWKDVVEMGATAFQYVGEQCRYLLSQPESEFEREHAIRLCVGNGLRPDIWEEFRDRFQIPHIVEFYGATEANVSLVNLEDRIGSIGRPAPGMTVALVRYDTGREEHVRDPAGHLVRCGEGEVGELLGHISEGRTAAGRFEGYTSKQDSEKKILRDAFETGDAWFRSGDLMRRDASDYYYFVDRIGDTFRWKGENVSTQEVADAVDRFPAVQLSAVYGVELPGADGRAGMAAVVLREGARLEGDSLYGHLADALPSYAMPAYVRVLPRLDLTSTFKIRKIRLREQGFDPAKTGDDVILYRDDSGCRYAALTDPVRAAIGAGQVRF
jgi:fatty-acyl-CoA synthase